LATTTELKNTKACLAVCPYSPNAGAVRTQSVRTAPVLALYGN